MLETQKWKYGTFCVNANGGIFCSLLETVKFTDFLFSQVWNCVALTQKMETFSSD